MKAHYFQHVPFEGLGSIEAWLEQAGFEISSTQFFSSAVLPELEDVDFLVVMGGPMSVNDETEYSWLAKEKAFIRKAIAAGKPVLGICLGAQLIADAMGGKVFANREKEIGWFPVNPVPVESNLVFQFPDSLDVFHWHGETFSLPEGATRLAESNVCANQAFQLNDRVIGLQFHLETTPESAQEIVEHCREELVSGEYIQSAEAILSVSEERYQAINRLMISILEYLNSENRRKDDELRSR